MGIGFIELVIIAAVTLVLFGPKRMPELLRQVAKFYVQLRRASNEFKGAFDQVVRDAEAELRQEEFHKLQDLHKQIKSDLPHVEISGTPSSPKGTTAWDEPTDLTNTPHHDALPPTTTKGDPS